MFSTSAFRTILEERDVLYLHHWIFVLFLQMLLNKQDRVKFYFCSLIHYTVHNQQFHHVKGPIYHYIYVNAIHHVLPKDESKANSILFYQFIIVYFTFSFNKPFGPIACLKICAPTCASTADKGSSNR